MRRFSMTRWSDLFGVRRDSRATSREHERREADVHDATGVRVLLVEDNEMNQQVATELLESAGAIVTVANHGGEAVEDPDGGPTAATVRRRADGPADARDGRHHGDQTAAARSAIQRSSRSSR